MGTSDTAGITLFKYPIFCLCSNSLFLLKLMNSTRVLRAFFVVFCDTQRSAQFSSVQLQLSISSWVSSELRQSQLGQCSAAAASAEYIPTPATSQLSSPFYSAVRIGGGGGRIGGSSAPAVAHRTAAAEPAESNQQNQQSVSQSVSQTCSLSLSLFHSFPKLLFLTHSHFLSQLIFSRSFAFFFSWVCDRIGGSVPVLKQKEREKQKQKQEELERNSVEVCVQEKSGEYSVCVEQELSCLAAAAAPAVLSLRFCILYSLFLAPSSTPFST